MANFSFGTTSGPLVMGRTGPEQFHSGQSQLRLVPSIFDDKEEEQYLTKLSKLSLTSSSNLYSSLVVLMFSKVSDRGIGK